MIEPALTLKTSRPCAHCQEPGVVGDDLMPYFVGHAGKQVWRWLHQAACSEAWHVKFREWLKTAPAGTTVEAPVSESPPEPDRASAPPNRGGSMAAKPKRPKPKQ